MTAIANADRNTKRRLTLQRSYPVAASVLIYEGAIVSIDASGNARPARSGTLTDRVVGRAIARADNSTGLAGAIRVEVDADSICCYVNSAGNDAIAATDIGRSCFVVDDQTLALTDGSGARPVAGKIHDVTSDGVWVDFRDGASGEVVVIPFEIADVGTAETVYKTVPVNGKIIGIDTVLHGAITGADSGITFDVLPLGVVGSAADVVGGDIVVAVAGSAAGIVDMATPTSGNAVRRGDSIRIVNDGNSTGAAKLSGTITIAVA